jgi:hypothetical protein
MSQLNFVRNKYKTRDLIEIGEDITMKVIAWLTGGLKDGQNDVRKKCQEISERGFITFLNRGVVVIKPKSVESNVRYYPFEFKDDKLYMSIYISNPYATDDDNFLELLCKIVVDTNTRYVVVDKTYNEILAAEHIAEEFAANKIGVSHLLPIIQEVNRKYSDLIPDSPEWRLQVSKEYFTSIIKAQIITMIGLHAYLSLLDKEILVTKIEQLREMKASDKGGRRNNRNPFYRYEVHLPDNYKPRKFDVNYILNKWDRPSHQASRWVRAENADLIAERCNGKVLWDTLKNGRVKVKRTIRTQTCHRRVGKPTEQVGVKTYAE